MDLWIRSQNKEQLIKINNEITIADTRSIKKLLNPLNIDVTNSEYDKVDGIDIIRDAFNVDGYMLTTDKLLLGIYKTKERALEVLDEIQNAISGIINDEELEIQGQKKYTGTAILSKKSNNIVYEMPKE